MDVDYSKMPDNDILCVDMKSFYASIEAVARGFNPMDVYLAVVGDTSQPGAVVLAASPALKKKYNIKTGNRLYEIPENPEILIVNARMGIYIDKSLEITRILNSFVPLEDMHVYSIDEAWLKLNGVKNSFSGKRELAENIKEKIFIKAGLSVSMGLGPNMFLAKVAMDVEGKKNGIAEWSYADVPEKLWPLPLKDCWGIGNRLARRFYGIGIKTVGELAHLPLDFLERKFGIMGNQLYYHAWGIDLSRLRGQYDYNPGSLGKGITLMRDYENIEEIETVIFDLVEDIVSRLRELKLIAKTLSLGINFSYSELKKGFHVQKTRENYTNLEYDIFQVCQKLFAENYQGEAVRKVRVSVSNFISEKGLKLNLFDKKTRDIKIAELKDELQDKFGYNSLFYARSLKKGSVRKKINTTFGGHKK